MEKIITTKEDKKLWNYLQSEEKNSVFSGAKYRLDLVKSVINEKISSGKGVEIGLGDGYLITGLIDGGYDMHGVDLSEVSVHRLSERFGKKASFSIQNFNDLNFKKETFDFLVASEVIEHLNDDDLDLSIKESYRVLKTGGFVLFTVPGDEDIDKNKVFCPHCDEYFHIVGHKQSFSKKRLETILSHYGFKDVSVKKFVEIEEGAKLPKKIMNRTKNLLINIPYFSSMEGRYICIGVK